MDEKDERLSRVAMEVILNAGDARQLVDQAMEKIAAFDFETAEGLFDEAEKKLRIAHGAQTETIQRQAAGEDVEYSLLFAHAQDTLMTISCELRMARNLMPVVDALYVLSAGRSES